MKYIINNTVVYSPGEGLSLATSETIEFKLSVIADKLLLLLITSKGETVTKEDIHNYLWSECSLDVSSSSINNNISHLRRYFKDMGVSDLIATTPRVGVGIRRGNSIKPLSEEIVVTIKENHSEDPEVFVVDKKKTNVAKWGVSVSIGLTLFCAPLFLFAYHNTSEHINSIGHVKDCKVFSLGTLSDTESGRLMKSVNTFVNDEALTCTDGMVIIASSQVKGNKYIRGSREFFAVCEMNENKLLACDNYYYLGGVG